MVVLRDYIKDKGTIKSFIEEYYESNSDGKYFPYKDQLVKLYEKEQNVLRVKLDHVYEYDEELCKSFESNCTRYQKVFAEVIDEIIFQNGTMKINDKFDIFLDHRLQMERRIRGGNTDDAAPLTVDQIRERFPMELLRRYEVYFIGRTNAKVISIRSLRAKEIGKLSKLKAIVSGVTQQKPCRKVATYTCDKCGAETYQEIVDMSYLPLTLCKSETCQRDGAGGAGKLHLQTRGSKHTPYQEIKVQELPDQVPVGSLPERLKVVCYGQNVGQVHPGDPIVISGVLLPVMSNGQFGMSTGLITERYFDAHTIEVISKDDFGGVTDTSDPTEEELKKLRDPEMYSIMARSIAPEIFGHEDIKKAILIMLAKGAGVNSKGLKIRGEINICLMGDPGVGKSQLLGFVDRLCPRSQFTNGKGTTGVGLTAAVTKDPLTKEMMLEGGALVLADGGICCIDEFDKMNETDRTYIHEVMEQQTISIAKAGIHAKLNARVSILAAANPAYGRYNAHRSLEQNIDLPAALLSRFDLMWLIRDIPDRTNDLRLAYHVMHVHMTNKAPVHSADSSSVEFLSMAELRRYLAIIQMQPDPKVPDNLVDYITAAYVSLCREARLADKNDCVFTSPRNLLAILRISTALARLHARSEVERSDVDEAVRLCESSKASVRVSSHDNGARNPGTLSYKSVIYDTVRKMIRQKDTRTIRVADIVEKCLTMGYTADQVEQVMGEYEELGVWMVNIGRTNITMM